MAYAALLVGFILMKRILELWMAEEHESEEFYKLGGVSVGLYIVHVFASGICSFYASKVGICLTKAINGLISSKLLTLSASSLAE